MSYKIETDLGQVLKVYWMWKSNFPRFLLRCVFRALIYFGVYMIVFLGLILIPGVAKLVDTDAGRIVFLLTCISWVVFSTLWTATDRIVVRERGFELYLSSVFRRSHNVLAWGDLTSIELREIDAGDGDIDFAPTLYMNPWPHKVEIGELIHVPISNYTTGTFLRRTSYKYIDPDKFVETDFGRHVQMYAPHVIEKLRDEKDQAELTRTREQV